MVKTFYFTSPGEYVVQLSRHISDDPDKEIVKSNKITITVVTAYTPEPEAGAPK
jgi:hypothetical protein